LAISAGVNVMALARMLGHTDPSVTLRVYADLFDTDLDAVAAALDTKCAQNVPKGVGGRRYKARDLRQYGDCSGGGGGI
jgi:hypothetical protein